MSKLTKTLKNSEHARRDTRSRAIATARDLLMKGGYPEMSMERVAMKIGIRTPSLYHHFPGGKKQLFMELVDQCTLEDSEAIKGILAENSDYVAALKRIARYFSSSLGRHPYHSITESRKHLPKRLREELQGKFAERVEAPLLAVINDGIANKHFDGRNPMLAVRALLVLLLSLGEFEASAAERENLPDFLIDIFINGLRAR